MYNAPTPPLHFVMILVAAIITLVCVVVHAFRPEDQLSVTVATAAFGFLFGKFSNQFGVKPGERKDAEKDERG